jgi:hypothetical protein
MGPALAPKLLSDDLNKNVCVYLQRHTQSQKNWREFGWAVEVENCKFRHEL